MINWIYSTQHVDNWRAFVLNLQILDFMELVENKLIICALGNSHYQISSEKLKYEPGFEPRTSGFPRPALYHLSYPGSRAS